MSDFLFYAIATLVVFWFVEQRPVAEMPSLSFCSAPGSEFIPELDVESFQPTPQLLQRQLEAIAAQNLYEQECAEFRELLGFDDSDYQPEAIALATPPVRIEQVDFNLPAPQIRALAQLYGVPCSRKGRISQSTISALAKVS